MRIEIKLESSKYCNKCPLLNFSLTDETGWKFSYRCSLGYFDKIESKEGNVVRPQKCIKENGL